MKTDEKCPPLKKLWPLLVPSVGLSLILVGFVSAQQSPYRNIALIVCLLGLVIFVLGLIAGIIWFVIRRHIVAHAVCVFVAIICIGIGLNSYCFSLSYIRGAQEDQSALWLTVLKPFGGQVYYVGSEGNFSYCRAGEVFCARYKAQTNKIHLPRTFPLGEGKPYIVTLEMVPEY